MIKYQTICNSFLKDLPQRTADVIERRFGLKGDQRETLELIGRDYGITRERVRQIEEEGFSRIKPKVEKCRNIIDSFNKKLESCGGIKREDILLSDLGGKKYKNQAMFLLTLADGFEKYPETENFYSLWAKNKNSFDSAKKIISLALNKLKSLKEPLTSEDLYKFLNDKINKNVFSSCLEISKEIRDNGEGKFGLRNWVEISPRGIKDKAYLVLKKYEKPLHFTEVASLIEKSPCFSDKKVHRATVHNELIKDSRFVLVGRGLYALSEWGYEPGVVKEVILNILKKSKKPLVKEEIVKQVSNQRIVKANTIVLNLQDRNYFLKDELGRYTIKES